MVIDCRDPVFLEFMKNKLMSTHFKNQSKEFFKSENCKKSLREQTYQRYERFEGCVLPWVANHFALAGKEVIEVGSGTGISTLSLAQRAERVNCYEISAKVIVAAKERLSYWGIANVVFEQKLFGHDCEAFKSGKKVDAMCLFVVLEHMYYEELKDTLMTAWGMLRDGGVIVIAETPNRLSPMDFHTSWVPFFDSLPLEVKCDYFDRSPRAQFKSNLNLCMHSKKSSEKKIKEAFVRWGQGISYHEFEIALGKEIHEKIIADGWQEEILRIAPVLPAEEALRYTFDKLKLNVSPAFARCWLYFIIRK